MDATAVKTAFKFRREPISPDVYIRRVNPDKTLRDAVESSMGVVTPRDINNLHAINSRAHIKFIGMPKDEIINLIQRIQDAEGNYVYRNTIINSDRISPGHYLHSQTFVEAEKIVNMNGLTKLFDIITNPGLSKMAAQIIVYENGTEKYVALYLPAIVEVMDKSLILPVLGKLRERSEIEPTIKLDAFGNGRTGILDLKELVRKTDALISNNTKSINVLRDGTHRSYLIKMAGTTIHSILINGAFAIPTGVPMDTNDLIVTNSKPKELEDRYLGFLPRSWMNYKDLGIDG